MENNIEKFVIKIENAFDEENYFKNILLNCYNTNLLSSKSIEEILVYRMELLKKQLEYYTKKESSSVMIETAENILESIDFSIGFYLKDYNDLNCIAQKLKNTHIKQIFEEAMTFIKGKVEYAYRLLKLVKNTKLKISNYSYNDTIDNGFTSFFKKYDYFFHANEVDADVDYQLSIDVMRYSGIEYVIKYLEALYLENKFCSLYSNEEIEKLLKSYAKESEILLINVFDFVLTNALGRILCGKTNEGLDINEHDREQIKEILGGLTLSEVEEKILSESEKFSLEDDILKDYVDSSLKKLAPFIYENINADKLESIFLSFKDYENSKIQYIDKKRLDNRIFRRLTERIRDSVTIDQKLYLIKNNIGSFEDLVDMLNSECLFDEEYIRYFESMSQIELVLLLKYIEEIDPMEEWSNIFKKYIESLDEALQKQLEKIEDKIEFSKY